MIEQAALLKSAAGQIDALDAEIKALNVSKKDIFANIRQSVVERDYMAWRDAVKLRQKRKAPEDRDALEAHDALVWAMLSMLEAETVQRPHESRVDPLPAPAIGIVDEIAPTRAHAHVAHDPSTGEIADPVPVASVVPATGDEAAGMEVPTAPVSAADYSMPDIPEALDRRRRAA